MEEILLHHHPDPFKQRQQQQNNTQIPPEERKPKEPMVRPQVSFGSRNGDDMTSQQYNNYFDMNMP